jgi:heptosyltransferase-3
MRILVLQLARFGDIYLTWPVLRALKRQHPQAELHLVVRERYQDATVGLEDVTVHAMPSRAILKSLLTAASPDRLETAQSLEVLDQWLQTLPACDRVINLSFSALSSHMTRAVSGVHTRVAGYSRHDDGTFCPEGALASYYLAQVGVGGDNTFHLLHLFAMGAGVDLQKQDLRAPNLPLSGGVRDITFSARPLIAIQPYASVDDKSLGDDQWLQVTKGLLERTPVNILFIGSQADRQRLERWIANLPSDRIHNTAGLTALCDLFPLLKKSALLLAPDSVSLHMAGLAEVPTVNLTFSSVNAFETGPWGSASRIVYADEPELLPPARVVHEVLAALAGEPPMYDATTPPPYRQRLIAAMYEMAPFPMTSEPALHLAYQRLKETMDLALEQCQLLEREPGARAAMLILSQIDELVAAVVSLAPDLEPLERWMKAEMARIGPGSLAAILTRTQNLYRQLLNFAQLGLSQPHHEGVSHAHSQLDLA